jgi:hypothetical protein
MPSSLLSVSLLSNGTWQVSRYFSTVRAARNWARFLRSQSYVSEVAIHRGGQGGERVAL